MKCSNCKKEVSDSAKICGYCGTKLEKKRKHTCPECGKEVSAKAKVCGFCGAKLVKPAVKTEKPAPKRTKKPKPAQKEKKPSPMAGLPKWVIPTIGGGLVVVVLLVVLFSGGGNSTSVSPEPVESDSSSSQESSASSSSSSQTNLDAIAGTWEGVAGGDDGSFSIKFILKKGCQLDVKCGTFSVAEWGMNGDITFVDVEGEKYFFEASNKSGSDEASSDVSYEEYLRVISSTQLEYYARGTYGTSKGVLTKK